MHRNSFFLALIILVTLAFLYFAAKTSLEIYTYSRLSERIEAQVTSVEVEKVSNNIFQLDVYYSFNWEEKAVSGKAAFGRYPNHYVAEKEAKQIEEKKSLALWINPKNTSTVAFERTFPWKSLIYSALLLALGCYLFFLGRTVAKNGGGGSDGT